MRYEAYVIVILVEEPRKERKSMKKRCKHRAAAKKTAVSKSKEPRNASKGKKKGALKRKRKVMSDKSDKPEMTAKEGTAAFVFRPRVVVLIEDPEVVVEHAPKPDEGGEKAEGEGSDHH